VAKVGTSKVGGTISQQAAVHPWLAADAHGNKQTNKPLMMSRIHTGQCILDNTYWTIHTGQYILDNAYWTMHTGQCICACFVKQSFYQCVVKRIVRFV
jgi:hypothetical protein